MALTFLNQADTLALKALLAHTAGQNCYLKLYTNSTTIDQTFTEANFTEATGGGYTHKAITSSSWSFSEGATTTAPCTASYTTQTWTFTGALDAGATIRGYYITQESSGKALWAEAASSPFTPANNGDTFSVTLNVTANNAT